MAIMSLTLFAWGVLQGNGTGSPGMLRMAFGILAGTLVHRAYVGGADITGGTTLLVALMLTIAHLPGLASVGTLAFPVLVLLCARGNGIIARGCASRPVVFLGEISYSIYLWHWLVIQIFKRIPMADTHHFARDITVMTFVLILSAASFTLIEKPGRSWLLRQIPAPKGSVVARTAGPGSA